MSEKNYYLNTISLPTSSNVIVNPNRSEIDFIRLFDRINYLTRPIGLNIFAKLNFVLRFTNICYTRERHNKQITILNSNQKRLNLLLFILWLDLIYTAMVAIFVPTTSERLLLQLGDLSYSLFPKKRYLFFVVVFLLRASATLLVTMFVQNDFRWLLRANRLIYQLKTPHLYDRLFRLQRQCRLTGMVVIISRIIMVLSSHAYGVLSNYEQRDSKYFLIHTYVYMVYYACIYVTFNIQFLMQLYFLFRVCFELFDTLNHRYVIKCTKLHNQNLVEINDGDENEQEKGQQNNCNGNFVYINYQPTFEHQFICYYHQFNQACIFVHEIISYTRPIYVVLFLCNLIVDVFVLFSGIFSLNQLWLICIFFGFAIEEMSLIIFFASVIGQIDSKAKELSDLIYNQCLIDHQPSKIQRFKNINYNNKKLINYQFKSMVSYYYY